MYKFEPCFILYMYRNNVTKIGMPHGHNTRQWIKMYIYVYKNKKLHLCIPPIHLFYLCPLLLPLPMSSEKSSFLFQLLTGDPHHWTRGIDCISGDYRKTKICKLVYQPIKILCTSVQIPNQYNIFTYCTWVMVGCGASLAATLIGCSSSTTCSLSSYIKNIYANVNEYTCALGRKRWVTDLVLFKHQIRESDT